MNSTSAPSEVGVQISSSGSNFNYFVNWDNPAAGSISVPINQAGVYDIRIIGIPAVGNTTSNTTVCDIYTGDIEIQEVDNNQILRDIESIQPDVDKLEFHNILLMKIPYLQL